MYDRDRRKTQMLLYGFCIDEEFNCFTKSGYGMFLTNTYELNPLNNLEQMKKEPFYIKLLEEGCELVLGPPAPAHNGEIYCKNAVYISNYKDILRKRSIRKI